MDEAPARPGVEETPKGEGIGVLLVELFDKEDPPKEKDGTLND